MSKQSLIKSPVLWLPDAKGQIRVDAPSKTPKASSSKDPKELYAAFLRHAKSFERLTEAQEKALGYAIRDFQDEQASKKLLLHNLRLVIKIARQYQRSWTNLMDLIQEASAGMAMATKRWDPDLGSRFGSYSIYWMQAYLIKFLMMNGRLIHTANTRLGRKLYFQLPLIRQKLLQEGKEASPENIASFLNENPIDVAQVLERLQQPETSLSAPFNTEGLVLEDTLSSGESLEQAVAQQQVKNLAKQLVDQFEATLNNDRDKAIWREHLVSEDPKSLVELGKRYEVSKQRMGQLAIRLKKAFRCFVIEQLGPHTQLSWLFNHD